MVSNFDHPRDAKTRCGSTCGGGEGREGSAGFGILWRILEYSGKSRSVMVWDPMIFQFEKGYANQGRLTKLGPSFGGGENWKEGSE